MVEIEVSGLEHSHYLHSLYGLAVERYRCGVDDLHHQVLEGINAYRVADGRHRSGAVALGFPRCAAGADCCEQTVEQLVHPEARLLEEWNVVFCCVGYPVDGHPLDNGHEPAENGGEVVAVGPHGGVDGHSLARKYLGETVVLCHVGGTEIESLLLVYLLEYFLR